MIAAIVYAVTLLLFKGLTEEEILRNTETKEINPVWDKLLNKKNLK